MNIQVAHTWRARPVCECGWVGTWRSSTSALEDAHDAATRDLDGHRDFWHEADA